MAMDNETSVVVEEPAEVKHEISKVKPDAIIVVSEQGRLFCNPRKTFNDEEAATLIKSIIRDGLMKPLLLKPLGNNGKYELVAGERRLRAIRYLIEQDVAVKDIATGDIDRASKVYKYIPAVLVFPENDIEQLTMSVAENIESAKLTEWDIMMLCLQLDTETTETGEKKYSRDQIRDVFNKSPAWVSHTISLTELPKGARDRLRDGRLSRTAAIQLLTVNPEDVDAVLERTEERLHIEYIEEINAAKKLIEDSSVDLEIYETEAEAAKNCGDVIAEKLAKRRASSSKKKVAAAQHRIDLAKKQQASGKGPTAEALNRTIDEEMPNVRRPGAVKKARSPAQIRDKIANLETTFSCGMEEAFILPTETCMDEGTGKEYSQRDLTLVCQAMQAAWHWVLGEGDAACTPFHILEKLSPA